MTKGRIPTRISRFTHPGCQANRLHFCSSAGAPQRMQIRGNRPSLTSPRNILTLAMASSFQHRHRRASRRRSLPAPVLFLTLAGQLAHALAARRQLRFLHDHVRKAVLDGKLEPAALAEKPVAFEGKLRVAGVERTAENLKEFRTNHSKQTLRV